MKVRRKLLELARAVADEAERNPGFAQKLETVFDLEQSRRNDKGTKRTRSQGRRTPAAFDPVAVRRKEGVQGLRSRLSGLDIEQLKDMVAQYGMDPGETGDEVEDLGSYRRPHRGDILEPSTKGGRLSRGYLDRSGHEQRVD